jgi:hypothetical protein
LDAKYFAQAFDSTVKRIVSRAKVDQQHLILSVVDNRGQVGPKLGQFERVELTEKDGKLRVVAPAFKVIENLPASFVVGNVVADDIVPARGHRVVMLV